jgi:hypothetical protein
MNLLPGAGTASATTPVDAEVREQLVRFFHAFDGKDWPAMRGCLCDEVIADYTLSQDLLGGGLSADLYIEQCRFALQVGDVRHTFFNLRIGLDVEGGIAEARCNYILHRFDTLRSVAPDYFNAYGHYEFALLKANGEWKISRVAQTVLRDRRHRQAHRRQHLPSAIPIRPALNAVALA